MLRIDGEYNYENEYSSKLKEIVKKGGKTAGGYEVLPNAPIAQAFLDKYILNDNHCK